MQVLLVRRVRARLDRVDPAPLFLQARSCRCRVSLEQGLAVVTDPIEILESRLVVLRILFVLMLEMVPRALGVGKNKIMIHRQFLRPGLATSSKRRPLPDDLVQEG